MIRKSLFIVMLIISVFLCSCSGKSSDVINVEKAISNIGEITLDNESSILEAEELYNDLSDEDKEIVGNYNELIEARSTYEELEQIHYEETLAELAGTILDDFDDRCASFYKAVDDMDLEAANSQAKVFARQYKSMNDDPNLYKMIEDSLGDNIKSFLEIEDTLKTLTEDCLDGTLILKPIKVITPEIIEEKSREGKNSSGENYTQYTYYFETSQDCSDAYRAYRDYLISIIDASDPTTISNRLYRGKKNDKMLSVDQTYDSLGNYMSVSIIDATWTSIFEAPDSDQICEAEECLKQATRWIRNAITSNIENFCDEHYKERVDMVYKDGSDFLKTIPATTPNTSKSIFTHICEACSKEGTHEIISPFSGEKEYYCDEHYQEMAEILGSMGFDVGSSKSSSGSSSTSSHTCEVCSKKATHEITSPFSGQKEYYCDEHYKEMSEVLGSMLLQ